MLILKFRINPNKKFIFYIIYKINNNFNINPKNRRHIDFKI